jgi:predicted alpha/beta-hydrolase family hydrolase
MRVEHLPRLAVPCLFVSGTRDAFATTTELEAATAAIPGDVTHVWVEGGNHGLRGKVAQVTDAVRDWAVTLAAGGPRG